MAATLPEPALPPRAMRQNAPSLTAAAELDAPTSGPARPAAELAPLLPGLLHLSPHAFGLWSGASIHETAQVVAAARQLRIWRWYRPPRLRLCAR